MKDWQSRRSNLVMISSRCESCNIQSLELVKMNCCSKHAVCPGCSKLLGLRFPGCLGDFCLEDSSCGICLEETGTFHQLKDCGHLFHRGCLARWTENNDTCPYCRVNLLEPDIFELGTLRLDIRRRALLNFQLSLDANQQTYPEAMVQFLTNIIHLEYPDNRGHGDAMDDEELNKMRDECWNTEKILLDMFLSHVGDMEPHLRTIFKVELMKIHACNWECFEDYPCLARVFRNEEIHRRRRFRLLSEHHHL
ncbi:hypothetical protein JTE90_027650 [Oedothorax gibbosus]|uniref:RING-type domain-containing protein n=1 Tax=Oedothorax gibbosus TaxID=931172 RepID=A0AAV6UQN7_9ARAC|nr:hypothetical protein JTE90_027650 [Oedothorax gibbosus]